MTKSMFVLGLTSAVMLAGVLMWKAEATPLAAAGNSLATIKSYSAVHKAGCMFGTRRCPAGSKHSCTKFTGPTGPVKKCVCRPC